MVNSYSSSITKQRALHDPDLPGSVDLEYAPDQLGSGFGHHFFEMGSDPDGQAPVRCTLVRYFPTQDLDEDAKLAEAPAYSPLTGAEDTEAQAASRPAVLFVHGMTDYFFQKHVARFFAQRGFEVYGLDLRKCGRSWREGQTWHHVSKQSIYDQDLTVAASAIARSHKHIFVCGHSTGGLDVSMWSARLRREALDMPESPQARLFSQLQGVVLNSPWIGLQFGALTSTVMATVFPILNRFAPQLPLPGGLNPRYGQSLHASAMGEWDYNLELKPMAPRPKMLSWLVGVIEEIRLLHTGNYSMGLPTLLLCSDKHEFSRKPGDRIFSADGVLKPNQMRQYIMRINKDADIRVIPNAVHDVFLSRGPVRNEAMNACVEWMQDQLEGETAR